jgi:hypothetical protein
MDSKKEINMGYYVQVPENLGKAKQIVDLYGGEIIPRPETFSSIPSDKGLIVVISNGLFEAAGYAYDQAELDAFTDPDDERPKKFVLMNKAQAEKLSGYKR